MQWIKRSLVNELNNWSLVLRIIDLYYDCTTTMEQEKLVKTVILEQHLIVVILPIFGGVFLILIRRIRQLEEILWEWPLKMFIYMSELLWIIRKIHVEQVIFHIRIFSASKIRFLAYAWKIILASKMLFCGSCRQPPSVHVFLQFYVVTNYIL